MHLKTFTTDQLRVAARALQEHWQIQRSRIRAHSARQVSMLRAGQTEGFVEFVEDLVCFFATKPSPLLILLMQADLLFVYECARKFDLDTFVTDTDLSLMQEVIVLATEHPELAVQWGDAISYVCMMMDVRQREWFAFERLYPEALEAAVLFGGTEEDPIVVEDRE